VKFKYDTMGRVPLPAHDERLAIISELADKGEEPSPDALLLAASNPSHPAHKWVYNPDVDWSNVGRREYCRQWVQKTEAPPILIGGKTYTPRAVEYVKVGGEGHWQTIQNIVTDDDLFDGYLAECARIMESAQRKLQVARELRRRK